MDITLKATEKDGIISIKEGRSLVAKVYETKGVWAAQANGMVNYCASKEDAFLLVAERRENRANAFGGDCKVSII